MQKNTVPLYYHSTKIILIDDNPDFLNTLKKGLIEKGLECMAFTDPHNALEFLNNISQENKPTLTFQKNEDENFYMSSISQKKFDIRTIYYELLNPERLMDISVVVIDYDMPMMKGDEFAITLTSTHIKKLMLTGQVDYPTAVKLLNHKIIDNFAEKKLINGIESIYNEICKLQKRYFCDLTRSIEENFFNANILNSAEYLKIVNDIIDNNSIVEHYVISKDGSRLFLERSGQQHWLIIASEDDLNGWCETANLADAPIDIIQALSDKSKLLFLFDDEEINLLPISWGNSLYPAKKIPLVDSVFYYALISKQKYIKPQITSSITK